MSSKSSAAIPTVPTPEVVLSSMADQAAEHMSACNWVAARDVLVQAIVLAPRLVPLHAALATVHWHLRDYVAAAAAYTRAIELAPNDADLLKQGAHVYLEMNQRDRAEQLLRQAVLLQPDDGQLREMLRRCQEPVAPAVAAGSPSNSTALVKLDPGLTLKMGDYSYVHGNQIRNPSCAITHLSIGRFCSIATDLTIIGYDHRSNWITTYPFLDPWTMPLWPGTANATLPGAAEIGGNFDRGNITIGNDVWIGYGVKLFKGITIGDGAVVGACSLVNKDVPPYTIVAGIPARPLRKRFTEEEITILRRLAWWDWPEWKINRYMPYLCSSRIAELEEVLECVSDEIPPGPLPETVGSLAPGSIDYQPIAEILQRRPASAQGAISNDDAKFIYATIADLRPDVVFEIGVASGVSSAVILQALDVHAPHASLISYDIAPQCYFDSTLPVGYSVPLMIPGHRARFQLLTGSDKLAHAKSIVAASRRKLIFIDANHNPPYPALDLLHTLDLVSPGDVYVFHDINLPVVAPAFAYSCGAMELYQILPEPKWSSSDPHKNIGAYRFNGDYHALGQVLSSYLSRFKITKESQAALARLATRAGKA